MSFLSKHSSFTISGSKSMSRVYLSPTMTSLTLALVIATYAQTYGPHSAPYLLSCSLSLPWYWSTVPTSNLGKLSCSSYQPK